jgi:hypothetical protein
MPGDPASFLTFPGWAFGHNGRRTAADGGGSAAGGGMAAVGGCAAAWEAAHY